MAEIPMFLRYSPALLLTAGLSACSSNIVDSKVLLAVAKTASMISSPVKDKKIMTPAQVSQMIKSLKADVAKAKTMTVPTPTTATVE